MPYAIEYVQVIRAKHTLSLSRYYSINEQGIIMKQRRTLQEFIDTANLLYDGKFDYSKSIYKNNYTKLVVTCPIHGDFEQTPLQHLRGNGCIQCSARKAKDLRIERFLETANNLHNNKYTYDTSTYKDNRTPIRMQCPKHGEFFQSTSNHLKGHGCRKCQYETMSEAFRKPQQVFIDECNVANNYKYDYSKTEYAGKSSKIIVTCPEHGDFEQWAGHHIRGVGCQVCSPGGFNKSKPGILYYLSINNGECYKIGITNLSVSERYTKTELEKITLIEEVYHENGEEAYIKEQDILKKYKKYQYTTTKPLIAGNTELFSCDLLNIKENNEITSIREL